MKKSDGAFSRLRLMSEARAAYRTLQRTIKSQLSLAEGNQWQVYVRELFRQPAGQGRDLQQELKLAEDCADLLSSVKSHKVST